MEESDTSQKEGVSSPDIFNSCSTPAARETERVGSSRWVELPSEDCVVTVMSKGKLRQYPAIYPNYG